MFSLKQKICYFPNQKAERVAILGEQQMQLLASTSSRVNVSHLHSGLLFIQSNVHLRNCWVCMVGCIHTGVSLQSVKLLRSTPPWVAHVRYAEALRWLLQSSCRPRLRYGSGDGWVPESHGRSRPLQASAPPVWFPKSVCKVTSLWLLVESFLLKDFWEPRTGHRQLWDSRVYWQERRALLWKHSLFSPTQR